MKDDNTKTKEIICSTARSIGASFPLAASIVHAWSEQESKKRWDNCQEFFKEIFSELKELKEEFKKIPYPDPDEMQGIISLTLEKVMREHREEKRKKFAEFFVKTTCMGKKITFDDKQFFLEILDELNESDLDLLIRIKNEGKFQLGNLNGFFRDPDFEELNRYIISFSKLESKGLIGEMDPPTGIVIHTRGSMENWENKWRLKCFEVLPKGKEFLDSLTISDVLKDENTT